MSRGPFCGAHSHGDLHSLDIIEDRTGARRKHGLPARYSKGRFLGKGGFAKCYEVQDMETREIFAAKIVAKASVAKPRAHAKLRSEIAIHRSLDNDKVVKFHDYFEDNEYVYIILELCPNQTLNEFVRRRPSKRLSEAETMFYAYELLVALKYLHRRRVIHRDLKLGNLFLDAEMKIKVGDFGLAAQLEHDGEKKRTICGTPNYIAPEILEGKHGHSYEVDIWSFGVILYTMVVGRPPFETSDVKTTYRRIRHNQYSFPPKETVAISEPVKELIQSILQTDPRMRPSLDDIAQSAWFHCSQRVPPSMPVSVSSFAVSPRIVGGSSARSETPERGVADFARIDSPAPGQRHAAAGHAAAGLPLRDRAPGPAHGAAGLAQPPHPPLRGHSAAPSLGGGKPLLVGPAVHNVPTPSRAPSSGRPPLGGLTHRGGDENAGPLQDQAAAHAGSVPALGHVVGQALPVAHGAPTTCRASTGSLPSARRVPDRAASLGPQHAAALGRDASPHPASAQDAAPRPTGISSAPLSAHGLGSAAPISSRSATCSPRQPVAGPLSCRAPSGACTPKEGHSRPVRAASSCGGCDGGAWSGNLFTRTTPAVLRSGGPPLSSRNPGAAGESPNQQLTPGALTPGEREDGSLRGTARLGEEVASARTPPHAAGAPRAFPAWGDRRPSSAQRRERSSSSPALLLDGQLGGGGPQTFREAADRRAGGVLRGAAVGRGGVPGCGGASAASAVAAAEAAFGARAPSSGSREAPRVTQAGMAHQPELWVTKWVDYSSKYGVGYILSDGSIGVYFNDSTKIVLVPDGDKFDYVTRRTQDKPELRSQHTFEDYPEDLKKKVTLLRHFKNYMLTDILEQKDGATAGESALPPPAPELARSQTRLGTSEPGQAPYVKKWTRNRHAIMFQLSNKIVQVVFFDRTEAVLSSKSHTVTYVDKRGQVNSYPLSNVLDVPSPELAKRLRYIKDILVNLLGARTDLAVAH